MSVRDKNQFHLQVGTVIDHQSTKMSIKDSNDISHKDMHMYLPINMCMTCLAKETMIGAAIRSKRWFSAD